MKYLERAKMFLKCKKMIMGCTNSGQAVVAYNYLTLASKRNYLNNKQFNYLSQMLGY